MQIFRNTLTFGFCILLAAGGGQAAESSGRYSLRQDFSPGDVLTETLSMSMEDGAVRYELPEGDVLTGTMGASNTLVTETEFLSPTKKRVRYVSDTSETRMELGGQVQTEEENGPLQGTVLIADMKDGRWFYRLESGEPTEAQAKELKSMSGTVDDQEAYPAQPVPAGHAWEIPPTVLRGFLGGDIRSFKGRVDSVLTEASTCGGHVCATIHSEGLIAGSRLDDDGTEVNVEMEMLMDETRKLGPGYQNKGDFSGTWKISGEPVVENEDGTRAVLQLKANGKLTGSYAANLTRKVH